MKGILLITALSLMFLIVKLSFADEERYCLSIKPTQYNDVWKRHFESKFIVNYDPDENTFVFYSDESLVIFGFVLTRTQADKLTELIDKYKEWNLKASEKKVTLQKEIGTFSTDMTFWKMGDDWSFGPGIAVTATFFSQTEQKHQLVFVFPKVTSRSNEFDSHKGETLYFDWINALELRKVLMQENVDKFLSVLKKQKELENQFQ